jgi:hypothetical protein
MGTAAGPRNGNGIFSYTTGSGSHAFRVRVRGIGHGYTVVATESHARVHRAMYPKLKALAPFTVLCECKGYTEFNDLMEFLQGYIYAVPGGAAPLVNAAHLMAVTADLPAPLGAFHQFGVPINGVSRGDHVGSMRFTPNIVFEAYLDPNDPQIFSDQSSGTWISHPEFNEGVATGDAYRFFYPTSSGSGNAEAEGRSPYDVPPPQPQPPQPPPGPPDPGYISQGRGRPGVARGNMHGPGAY